MKKFLASLLLLCLLLSTVSCSSSLTPAPETEPEEKTEEVKKTEEKTEEEEEPLPTGDIVYPQGFSVGYNRQSIAPEIFPIQTYLQFDHVGKSNHDPCQLTCTALSDGNKAFLLISLDLRGVPDALVNYSTKVIERATGIPKEQVFLNATHTHSSPDTAHLGEGENMKAWQTLFYDRLERAVVLALHDLTPAEAYVGTAHTDGVTFVRRYLLDDGSYMTNPSFEKLRGRTVVAHESEADTELRTIRFTREGKKDVLLANYQTHYHGSFPDSVSADFVHVIREHVEKEMDVHFAYHNGASGNLNFQSALGGRKYATLVDASTAIGDTVIAATKNEVKAKLGNTIQHEAVLFGAKDSSGYKVNVPFYTFACGDIAFCSAPYEMFDTSGMEIRAASPYKTTFVCAYTNGSFGYLPSAFAYPHGTYEVDITRFPMGTAELFVEEIVRQLNACHAKG